MSGGNKFKIDGIADGVKRRTNSFLDWLLSSTEKRDARPAFLRGLVVGVQLLGIALCFWSAFMIRFEFSVPDYYSRLLYLTIGPLLVIRLLALYYFKTLFGLWRYVTMNDVFPILKANVFASLIFIAFILLSPIYGISGFPRSVLVLEPLFSTLFLICLRLFSRWLHESYNRRQVDAPLQKAIIVGAGDAGIRLAKEILSNPFLGLYLVGFVDDNPAIQRLNLLGKPILGRLEDFAAIQKTHDFDIVITAIADQAPHDLSSLRQLCQEREVGCYFLPPLKDLFQDQPLWNQVRQFNAEEILGRKLVGFSNASTLIKIPRKDEVVLVTGAAGSIGSEICRQMAFQKPRQLIMVDQSESGLYDLHQELLRNHPRLEMVPRICDITDERKVNYIFSQYRPSLVYHAAAYKHVPLMEDEPGEAIKTNVLGSYYLGRAAQESGARRLIFISTDKAVSPIGVMGMSKWAAEKVLATGLEGSQCRLVIVRFGNVINSNGSVVPLFRRQVEEGGPVTVTHPEVSRFFMALEEAVSLVLAAGDMGRGNEIFLLDMGKPVKILDVAHQIIRMANLIPEKDIAIKFIGLRPGEKLHEELYWLGEGVRETAHPRIRMTAALNLPKEEVFAWVQKFSLAVNDPQGEECRRLLIRFVQFGTPAPAAESAS